MKPEPLAEKKIEPADLTRVPFGAQERSSAGGAKAAEGELEQEAAPGPGAAPAPASDGSGALALVDMALGVSVAYMAKRAKIPAAEVADLRKLDSDERALLAAFAPSAEPYLGVLAGNSPQVGAVIFAAAFALIAVSRFAELRERSRKARAEREPDHGDNMHRALFGQAAANIPKQTRIVDDGFPPKFEPSSRFQPPFIPGTNPDPLRPLS